MMNEAITMDPQPVRREGEIRFDRNELAGAFGDIGTDLPLIVGMIIAAKLDSASVLVLFGAMQVLTALRYRMPMPVQPLKAVAALVITQKLSGSLLYGGGLAIGLLMLALTLTGSINWLARVVPKAVVRGIQFGLGLQLTSLALRQYVQADGVRGYALAGLAFVIILLLIENRRYPAALVVVAVGAAYAMAFKLHAAALAQGIGFRLPHLYRPGPQDLLTGLVVLALPQISLSLGNSVLATQQIVRDLFPQRRIGVRSIGFTYSLMNLINPFFGGIPTCHGSGGMMGHYTFGARTGGSVILYGLLYLILGLFFSGSFGQIVQVFPLPILGVLLLIEGLRIMLLIRDTVNVNVEFPIAVLVGLLAGGLPYGYLVGLVVGTALFYLAAGRARLGL